MDAIDSMLITHLQGHGRESWARLGELTGLTGPAVAERVRRLEEAGTIRRFAALVDPAAVDAGLTAFVAVTLEGSASRAGFLSRIEALDEVQECHHVAGDDDYLLKLRCRDTLALDRLLSRDLKGVRGVTRTRTTIVLRTAKETTMVPVSRVEVAA
ncbi:MAG: Lrp/AsnC family transcriptional regulator [Gemmatimonadetes bacterium]|nr:Lrp/AsnC family transcriptional regulator [Gemmatimonadota bacterium]